MDADNSCLTCVVKTGCYSRICTTCRKLDLTDSIIMVPVFQASASGFVVGRMSALSV